MHKVLLIETSGLFITQEKKSFKEQKSTKIKGTESAHSEERAARESKCWMGVDTQGNGTGYTGQWEKVHKVFLRSHYPTAMADAKEYFLLCLSGYHLSHHIPDRVSRKIFLLSVLCPFPLDSVAQLWFCYPTTINVFLFCREECRARRSHIQSH